MQLGLGMTEPQTLHYGLWDGSSTVLCAYVIVVILIITKRKEFPNAFLLFVPMSAMLMFICYFPPTSRLIYEHFPNSEFTRYQVIRRFRWIILLLPMLAFGLTQATIKLKTIQKAMFAMICVSMVFISIYGSDWSASGLKTGYWNRGDDLDHLYKIPKISLAMGETITRENADLFSEDKHNYVRILVNIAGANDSSEEKRDGWYYAECLREYLSPVLLTASTYTINNYWNILYYSDNSDPNYGLCPDDPKYIRDFEKAGYAIEWELDGYCFLKKQETP